MGAYTTKTVTTDELKQIVNAVRSGFIYDGINHRPNEQIAEVLILQSNLGMRIGDILHMSLSDIIRDGSHYRLDIIEQKTGKRRVYLVPDAIYNHIWEYCAQNKINANRRIFQLTERTIQKTVKVAREYLQLDGISTHSFRKYAACQIYENSGYDVEATREFLQHSSVATTQRYIKRSRPQLESAIMASVTLV